MSIVPTVYIYVLILEGNRVQLFRLDESYNFCCRCEEIEIKEKYSEFTLHC